MPSSLVKIFLRTFAGLPAYLVNFLKYPCVISDAAFRRDFAWQPQADVTRTLVSAVDAARRKRA